MNKLTSIFTIFILWLLPVTAVARKTTNINDGWKFCYGALPGAESMSYDDTGWKRVDLPHDFQIHQPWVAPSDDEKPDLTNQMANIASRLSSRGFKEMGQGWYRKEIIPDDAWHGRRVLLDFEGIMLVGDVYLNGERVGGTDYGYLGFEIDVTDKLRYGSTNIIAVKADTGKPENSRWYTGGGLFRDVNIKVTDPAQYFTRHPLAIVTPVVDRERSTVVVDAEIATFIKTDSIRVGIEIFDKRGECVYRGDKRYWVHPRQHVREFRLDSISIDDVELWDCDNPVLYTMEVSLYRSDGTVADKVSEHFGIRSLEFSPDFGMKLNGKKILLKGIANHHTLGALGAAAYPRAMEKRIQLLKDFGFNHIRTSHNPYSESFLDLCDEYGILVVDELYDKWTSQYSGGRTPWSERWQNDVPEWVKRDRNHPSVVFWSLGNELQLIPDLEFNDWGVTPYKLQKTLLTRYDSTRPVTVAMHPRGRNEHTDSLPAPLVMETDIAAMYEYDIYNTAIHVFLSTGSSFDNWQSWYSELKSWQASRDEGRLAVGDFSGDGLDDVAAMYNYDDHVTIHVWVSDATVFRLPDWWITETQFDPENVTGRFEEGDFNGDGIDDIVTLYDYNSDHSIFHMYMSDTKKFHHEWWNDIKGYDARRTTGIKPYTDQYVQPFIFSKKDIKRPMLFTKINFNDIATVHNNSDSLQNATVILTKYTDGVTNDFVTYNETFAPNETKTYSHGANARVFVWDSLMGMKPLAQ